MTPQSPAPLLALSSDPVTMFAMADAFRKAHDEHAALKIAKVFASGQREQANIIVGLRAALEPLLTAYNELLAAKGGGEVLSACRAWIERHAEEMGYGYWRPENPHDFTPDRESCADEEIEAHKEACAAWDRGDYKRDESGGWVTPDLHILKAPWGIGTYVMRDREASELIAKIDALTPPAPGSDGGL